jgi:hypothetical protein
MDKPTPATAPIKRKLSDEERQVILNNVLDEGSVNPNEQTVKTPLQRPFVLRPHLMQRAFASDPAFAELARQSRENNPRRNKR